MSNNSNSSNSSFFSKLTNAVSGVVTSAVSGNKRNNSVKPVTAEYNVPVNNKKNKPAINQALMSGGMASIRAAVPLNMRQPSEPIMEWATTAGLPMPLSGTRNIAHGGKRRKSHRRQKKHNTLKHKKNRRHTVRHTKHRA